MKRRQLLVAASGAVLAPIAAAASHASAATPDPVAENPRLIEMAEAFPQLVAQYDEAAAAHKAAWDRWSAVWPLAPDACTDSGCSPIYSHDEKDLAGRGLIRPGEQYPRRIRSMEWMQQQRANLQEFLAKDAARKKPRKGRALQHYLEMIAELERGIALLPAYLAEVEQIRAESNHHALLGRARETCEAMFSAVRAILEEPAEGPRGVMLKASAAAALGRVPTSHLDWVRMRGLFGNHKPEMAALLGQAVLDVLAS